MMKEERSFGVVPFRKLETSWQVFLVQHREGHWGFPKGHQDPGETALETAIRELFEETGLKIQKLLVDSPLFETYVCVKKGEKIQKINGYFLALVEGTPSLQEEEIQNGIWVLFDRVDDLLTFPEGKEFFLGAKAQLNL